MTSEKQCHQITFPNSFEDPLKEEKIKNFGKERHKNYIGGFVLLEM